MLEYTDGNFSDIMPKDEAMEELQKIFKENQNSLVSGVGVKALHIGTVSELERIKRKKSLEKRMDELQEQLKELQAKQGPTSELEPTKDEMIQMLRDKNLKVE